jgi:hypothetical protein
VSRYTIDDERPIPTHLGPSRWLYQVCDAETGTRGVPATYEACERLVEQLEADPENVTLEPADPIGSGLDWERPERFGTA